MKTKEQVAAEACADLTAEAIEDMQRKLGYRAASTSERIAIRKVLADKFEPLIANAKPIP